MIYTYKYLSIIKLVDILPPRSPDNARDKGAAIITYSEVIKRALSPLTI